MSVVCLCLCVRRRALHRSSVCFMKATGPSYPASQRKLLVTSDTCCWGCCRETTKNGLVSMSFSTILSWRRVHPQRNALQLLCPPTPAQARAVPQAAPPHPKWPPLNIPMEKCIDLSPKHCIPPHRTPPAFC